MLGKLVKQEIKSQSRAMLGIYGILAGMTLLISILVFLRSIIGNDVLKFIYPIFGVIYIMTLVVCFVAGFIYLCVHFYQTMYTGQGYLTHTLPVHTIQILNTKILVSVVYFFLTGACCVLSIFAVACSTGTAGYAAAELVRGIQTAAQELGISGIAFGIFLVAVLFFGCLDALLLFFAGSSIGQLFGRSKGACGIAAGIGLYYVTQILSVILVAVTGTIYMKFFRGMDVRGWMVAIIIGIVFWSAVYYSINYIILLKHLNLE